MLPGWRVRRWRRRRATSFLLLLMIVALTLSYCLRRGESPRAVLADPVALTSITA